MKATYRGSTVYSNKNTGVEITVSAQAEKIIGPSNVPTLAARLTEFIATTAWRNAYVSKSRRAIIIYLYP